MIPEGAIKELVEAVGEENVFMDRARLSIYSRGSIDSRQCLPGAVARVHSSKQASMVMQVAYAHGIPVVARGGGSSPTGAVVPVEGGLVLDMKGMAAVNVSVENGYVEAGAGATLADVDLICREHGFFFPPDPSSVSVATVGGAINENSGGMRCAKYGVMKDWILKIEAVMSDGTITTFGENTYKNRAGYNLVGLIAGSEGTLCIVTRAWLKIMPVPERTVRIAAFFDRLEDAGESMFRIRRDGVGPLILEYTDRFGIKAANDVKGWSYPESRGGMVLVDIEVSGSDSQRVKTAENIFRETGAAEIRRPGDEGESDRLFEIRRIAFAAPGKLFSGFIDGDIVVPLEKLREALSRVEDIREKYGVYIATCGHAGDGNLHPQIGANIENEEEWRKAGEASNEINRMAMELGGSISGEHGIGTQKGALMLEQLRMKDQGTSIDLMRMIKKSFDPKGILNPGKFALGIQEKEHS